MPILTDWLSTWWSSTLSTPGLIHVPLPRHGGLIWLLKTCSKILPSRSRNSPGAFALGITAANRRFSAARAGVNKISDLLDSLRIRSTDKRRPLVTFSSVESQLFSANAQQNIGLFVFPPALWVRLGCLRTANPITRRHCPPRARGKEPRCHKFFCAGGADATFLFRKHVSHDFHGAGKVERSNGDRRRSSGRPRNGRG